MIKVKVDSLVEGFYSVVDQSSFSIFKLNEVDFILSGQLEINIDDWKKNTIYQGEYNEKHQVSI